MMGYMASKQSSSSKILTVVVTIAFALVAGVIAYATWQGGAFQLRSKAAAEEAVLKQWTFDSGKEGWSASDWGANEIVKGVYSLTVGKKSEESNREEVCTGQKKNNNYKCKTKTVTRLFDPRIENGSDVTLSYAYNRFKMTASVSPISEFARKQVGVIADGGAYKSRMAPTKVTARVLYKINNRTNYESPLEVVLVADGAMHEVYVDFPKPMALRKITNLRVSFGELRTNADWRVLVDSIVIAGRKEETPPSEEQTYTGFVRKSQGDSGGDTYYLIGMPTVRNADSNDEARAIMKGARYLLKTAAAQCPNGAMCKMLARQIDFSRYVDKYVTVTGTVLVSQDRSGTPPTLLVKSVKELIRRGECTPIPSECSDGTNPARCRIPLSEGEWWCPNEQGVTPGAPRAAEGGCVVGGCSGQICMAEGSKAKEVSTCVWRNQYTCYRNAICGRNESGQCAWKETSELNTCLESYSINKDKGCRIDCPANSACNEECPNN